METVPIAKEPAKPEKWQVIAAVVFSAITLLFLMGLVVFSLTGRYVDTQSRWLVILVLALGVSLSFHFIGGIALASGKGKLRWMEDHPVTFKLGGGILVFFMTLILAAHLFNDEADTVEVVPRNRTVG